MTTLNPHAAEVFALSRACQFELSQHKPEVQGGALATLVAAWVTSCFVDNDREATKKVRANLLREHLFHVKQLVQAVEAALEGETLQ